MKKIFMTIFAFLASFSVLATNMVPVSAPTLASERAADVTYLAETKIAAPPEVVEHPLSIQPPPASTEQFVAAPVPVPAPAPVPISVPRVVRLSEPAAVVQSESVKAIEIITSQPETPVQTLAPRGPASRFVSDWLNVPFYVVDRVRNSPIAAQKENAPNVPSQPALATARPDPAANKPTTVESITTIATALALAPAVVLERVVPRNDPATAIGRNTIEAPNHKTVVTHNTSNDVATTTTPQVSPLVSEETKTLPKLSAVLLHLPAILLQRVGSRSPPPIEPLTLAKNTPPAPTIAQDELVPTPPPVAEHRVNWRETAKFALTSLTYVMAVVPEVSSAIFKEVIYARPLETVAVPKVEPEASTTTITVPKPETVAPSATIVAPKPETAASNTTITVAKPETVAPTTRIVAPKPETAAPTAATAVRKVEPATATAITAAPEIMKDERVAPIGPVRTAPVTSSPVRPLPVLISSSLSFSPALLAPLARPVLPLEMPYFDAPVTSNAGGPSIESAPVNDKPVVKTNPDKRASDQSPVLITAQSGFSAEMLKPLSTRPVFPPNPFTVSTPQYANGILPTNYQEGSYCDPKFVGPPIRFSQTVELKFEDLLNQLNSRFGVNFILGPEIGKLPLNVKAGSIPWNVLLRSQLYVSGVKASCVDENTIELVLNSRVAELEKGKYEAEKLESKYIKLKYLQPSSSSNKNVAGQSTTGGSGGSQGGQGGVGQGGCQQNQQGISGQGGASGGNQSNLPQRCKFERLMNEIRQILGLNEGGAGVERIVSDGGSTVTYKPSDVKRSYVGQVPGRNMLLVNATPSQLRDIDELIKRADVPPFQVLIKALVYTANEDKLKDIGLQTTIADIGKGRTDGGIFGHTLGTLGTLFDFSTLVGTVDFNVQASALQRDGVISIKSRPFATVLDGDTTDLTVGRQVPVLVQAINPIGGQPGTLQILQAANLLSVTPHVIDDDKGNPTAVNLELQLESNDVDQSVNSQGVPAISVRSIQSNFILNQEQTAILGGFTVDSDSKTISKTPGLGDIPILGELFKRRVRSTQINRLYFAISVTVIPYGGVIEPVKVPGANPDPPSLTPELLKRAKQAEPKSVVPKKDPFR